MSDRIIVLYPEDQVYLKKAIEVAVETFALKIKKPGLGSYRELSPDNRKAFAHDLGIGDQTIRKYFKGGDTIECYPNNLQTLCTYIGEDSWVSFVEKNKGPSPKPDPRLVPEHTHAPAGGEYHAHKKTYTELRTVIVGLLAVAVLVFIVSLKVRRTPIEASMVVSAVTFVLEDAVQIPSINTTNYFRFDSVWLYGAPSLDATRNKLVVHAKDEQPAALEQISIPAGTQISIEKPINDQLFLRFVTVDSSADIQKKIEGRISNFKDIQVNRSEIIPVDSFKSTTKAVTFIAPLTYDGTFSMAIVNAGTFDLPWMVIREIRFLEKTDHFDAEPHSSIKSGKILFPKTSDLIKLEEFDAATITLSNPIRLSVAPKEDGIHVAFSGNVNQISVGSEKLNTPPENLMPRNYAIIFAAFPEIVWSVIFLALTSLVPLYWRWKKRLKIMHHKQ